MGGGGGSSSGGSKSSKKSRFSRRDNRVKSKIAGKTLKGKLEANFSQKQLNDLKKQHDSFKTHQKAGTLSTHQQKYGTGQYALSGAERAQQMARDKIAKAKSWNISKLGDSITKGWKNLDKALARPDNYKNLPSFMGDAQVTSGDWTRAKDTAINIGKWGKDVISNTLKDTKGGLIGSNYRSLADFANQKPSLQNIPTAFTKGRIDNFVGIGSLTPESWGIADKARNYLSSTAYTDPTLKKAYTAGKFYPGVNLAAGALGSLGKAKTTANIASKAGLLRKIGAGIATGATAIGQTRNLYGALSPPESRTKDLLNLLNTDVGKWAVNTAENIKPLSNYFTDKIETGLQPAFERAEDMKGLKGWWAGRQVRQAKSELANQDLSGLLDRATMVSRTYEKHQGKIPGTWGLVTGGIGDTFNKFIGRDPNDRPVRSPVTESRETMRIGRGRGGKIRVKDVDLNKIGAQTSNIYAAAQNEQDLTAFWKRQNLLNKAAEQRLKDIETDRSTYSKLVSDLDAHGSAYELELDRLKPYGKSYTDELARIQPIGKSYSDELARIQPFGKQFTSSIADLTKGRDELRSYQGKWTHPEDVKFLNEQLPQYDTAISDLEKQYKEYQTTISNLTKEQKDYQSYLSDIQSGYKDYQSYLGEVRTGQKELIDYTKQIKTERSQLEDYASAFTAAKQASDQAAKSYTIRAQQGISGNVRQGVSGIRAQGGFRTIGSNKNRSAKRRFNRDFRIGSFGSEARIQPINV